MMYKYIFGIFNLRVTKLMATKETTIIARVINCKLGCPIPLKYWYTPNKIIPTDNNNPKRLAL